VHWWLYCQVLQRARYSIRGYDYRIEPPHRNQSIRYSSIGCKDIAHVQNRCSKSPPGSKIVSFSAKNRVLSHYAYLCYAQRKGLRIQRLQVRVLPGAFSPNMLSFPTSYSKVHVCLLVKRHYELKFSRPRIARYLPNYPSFKPNYFIKPPCPKNVPHLSMNA